MAIPLTDGKVNEEYPPDIRAVGHAVNSPLAARPIPR